MPGMALVQATPASSATGRRVSSSRYPRRGRARRRLALALLVAAGEAIPVTLLGTLAGAAVAAASIPPISYHLLWGFRLQRRLRRNLSWVAATAQALATVMTLAAAAGRLEG